MEDSCVDHGRSKYETIWPQNKSLFLILAQIQDGESPSPNLRISNVTP